MAEESAAFQQRARKPGGGGDKGERGERRTCCLGATKQYCEFEFFLFRLLAIFRINHLHPHSPPNTPRYWLKGTPSHVASRPIKME